MREGDTLQRFLFDHSHVRGMLVHLSGSYQAVSERYDYPQWVQQQLGQALAASSLLGSTIKFTGSLIMQLQTSGAISMLVAQCTHDKHVRGLARWQDEANEGIENTTPFGQGNMIITINSNRNEERYQGIVSMESGTLAKAIENYFQQSEQLQTRLWLAADENQVVGMLLQHLPGQEADKDIWERIETLGATITNEELLTLSTEDLLFRLFHEEEVRLFDPEPVSFRCSCSRDKIVNMLRTLGLDEANDIIKEQGKISVGCDFCNQQYEFDRVDVEEVFASSTPAPGSSSTH
ncbi:Hsp33 family molecular chaperone HslO [Pseudomonadota bacterium]